MAASNTVALREALVEIDELTNLLDISETKKNLLFAPSHSFVAVKMRKIIKKALEEPARNCDVGTYHGQYHRFCDFCANHKCDISCPAYPGGTFHHTECVMRWAQIPYEKGGDNETK